jgi:hypothetical protein
MFPKPRGSRIEEEANKFLLLPQEGIDHDVYLDLPPRNGNMIDESPRLPIGNLKRDSHLGREKDVMSIYQLLHTEEEPSVGIGSVVCITGPVGIGKTEVYDSFLVNLLVFFFFFFPFSMRFSKYV